MNLKAALGGQLHAGLAMLDQCIERCPDDLWTAGKPPREFWRIAFHAAFYAQLYLGQEEAAFAPWPGTRRETARLWTDPGAVEPYELDAPEPYTPVQMRAYVAFVDALVDPTLAALDLDAPETGFSWYPDMTKLEHELLNLRHLQGHVGQLSELLMARGIETDWIRSA